MSRIEKALENASKLRETTAKAAPAVQLQTPAPAVAEPLFEMGAPFVDKTLVDRHIVLIADPESPAVEQYRRLRARILRIARKDDLNTFMISSADAGEGKTITAINLAVAIARELDHTVLLVDADLRNPTVHKYLGLKPQCGLSDYLMNKARLPEVLVKTGIGKLVLLPAGTAVENPTELLASERMRGLVRELKQRYQDRHVIFDSAPVLLAADALSLGNYMDGIIFVVQADRTAQKTAAEALTLLKGYNVLGCVFNNVPAYLGRSGYPYHYSYGGRYPTGNSRKAEDGKNGAGPKTE